MQTSLRVFLSVAAAAACFAAAADTVRLSGSTTVINQVVQPQRAAVEKASGHTLEIAGIGSGKGLAELVEGKADIAMISDHLDVAAASAEGLGKKIDTSRMKTLVVRKGEIVFVTHPANPVAKLTPAQITDIHTGKVTNWKQLGGADKPITVYIEQASGGVRSSVRKFVMGGAEYTPQAKVMTTIARVADVVAGDEGGIGAISRAFVKADRNRVIDGVRVDQPLTLVTLGEPTGKTKAVIEVFAAAAK
jgi:phosphate transport system substrate-binding protein